MPKSPSYVGLVSLRCRYNYFEMSRESGSFFSLESRKLEKVFQGASIRTWGKMLQGGIR